MTARLILVLALTLAGLSDGSLPSARLLPVGEPADRAVARDFDGDGRIDLAVLSEGGSAC